MLQTHVSLEILFIYLSIGFRRELIYDILNNIIFPVYCSCGLYYTIIDFWFRFIRDYQ